MILVHPTANNIEKGDVPIIMTEYFKINKKFSECD